MRKLALVFLFFAASWRGLAEGSIRPEKIDATLGFFPRNKNHSWQVTSGFSFVIAPSTATKSLPELALAAGYWIQTVGQNGLHADEKWLRHNYHNLAVELRFRFWSSDALKTKLIYNHWSAHRIDADQQHGLEVNTLALEGRLFFDTRELAFLPNLVGSVFAQLQINHRVVMIDYQRPVILGFRLEVPDLVFGFYTKQFIEIGASPFYSFEGGVRAVEPLEIFISWNYGRQGFSGLLGGVPTSPAFGIGLRLHWELM
jgi:hypothetical protein